MTLKTNIQGACFVIGCAMDFFSFDSLIHGQVTMAWVLAHIMIVCFAVFFAIGIYNKTQGGAFFG